MFRRIDDAIGIDRRKFLKYAGFAFASAGLSVFPSVKKTEAHKNVSEKGDSQKDECYEVRNLGLPH